jgi:hypothetical protein
VPDAHRRRSIERAGALSGVSKPRKRTKPDWSAIDMKAARKVR